jgi:hypothetical protein
MKATPIMRLTVPPRLLEKLEDMVEMMPDIVKRLRKRDHLCPRGDLSAGASMLADIPESWPTRADDEGDPLWTLRAVFALALALGVQVLERDYWEEEGDRFEEAYEADRERRAVRG